MPRWKDSSAVGDVVQAKFFEGEGLVLRQELLNCMMCNVLHTSRKERNVVGTSLYIYLLTRPKPVCL